MNETLMTLSEENEYLLESALRMMEIGAWKWDVKNDHLILSKSVQELLKIDMATFDGSIDTFKKEVLSPDYLDIFNVSIIEAFATGVTSKTEYKLLSYDGSEYWVRFDGAFQKDNQGQVTEGSGMLINITALKGLSELVNKNFDFLETFIQMLPIPMYYKDNQGVFRYCNKAFSDFLGRSIHSIINHTAFDITATDLADFHFNKSLLYDKDGNPRGTIGLMMDITTQKNNQELIDRQNLVKDIRIHIMQHMADYRTENKMCRDLLNRLLPIFYDCDNAVLLKITTDDAMIDIVSSTTEDHTIGQYFSVPFSESYLFKSAQGHFEKSQLITNVQHYQRNKGPIVGATIDTILYETLYIPLFEEGDLKFIMTFNSSEKNHFHEVDCAIADYIGEQLPIIRHVFRLQQDILELSHYDRLTGLMNRDYFNERLHKLLGEAKEKKVHLMLLVFDLNRLNVINNTLGHAFGDDYLKTFARFMTSHFKDKLQFARLGGDEFGAVLSTEDPASILKKIPQAQNDFCHLPLVKSIGNLNDGFSYGIAIYPEDGENLDQLLTVSTQRMRDNKTYKK